MYGNEGDLLLEVLNRRESEKKQFIYSLIALFDLLEYSVEEGKAICWFELCQLEPGGHGSGSRRRSARRSARATNNTASRQDRQGRYGGQIQWADPVDPAVGQPAQWGSCRAQRLKPVLCPPPGNPIVHDHHLHNIPGARCWLVFAIRDTLLAMSTISRCLRHVIAARPSLAYHHGRRCRYSTPAKGLLPLEGYRVLDMTRVLAGVSACMHRLILRLLRLLPGKANDGNGAC